MREQASGARDVCADWAMRAGVLILAFVAVLLVGTSEAQAKPVLLLFHPGGFCWGGAGLMQSAADYARPQFHPVTVEYPRCNPDLGAEMDYAAAEAKQFAGREVYAYGESAGGSIAAWLAERGLVRAAAVQVPVADVPGFFAPIAPKLCDAGWQGCDTWEANARWLSPDRHPSERPIRVYEARGDYPSLRSATWAWVDHDPEVQGSWIPGQHLEEPYRTEAMHAAVHWLAN